MFSREKKSLRRFLRFVGHANELTVRRQPAVLQQGRDAVGIQPEGVEVHVMAIRVTDMAGFVTGVEGEKQIPARGKHAGEFSKHPRQSGRRRVNDGVPRDGTAEPRESR